MFVSPPPFRVGWEKGRPRFFLYGGVNRARQGRRWARDIGLPFPFAIPFSSYFLLSFSYLFCLHWKREKAGRRFFSLRARMKKTQACRSLPLQHHVLLPPPSRMSIMRRNARTFSPRFTAYRDRSPGIPAPSLFFLRSSFLRLRSPPFFLFSFLFLSFRLIREILMTEFFRWLSEHMKEMGAKRFLFFFFSPFSLVGLIALFFLSFPLPFLGREKVES